MDVVLSREFGFEAAHRNLSAPPGSKYARLHGHSYRVTVSVRGPVDSRFGWLEDFGDIKAKAKPTIAVLDHQLINDVEGITDASLADVQRWLHLHLGPVLPGLSECTLRIAGAAEYAPIILRTDPDPSTIGTIVFGFAAAHYLPRLPETHKCRRMHGHSFRVGIATSEISRLLARTAQLYPILDHQLLNDIDGLDNPTSEHLARWLWLQCNRRPGQVEAVTVWETCTAACTFTGQT